MKRNASAEWKGGLKDGKGTISSDSGVLADTQYSFSTRFENGKGTNPEELIAAAHAACFTMWLSNVLAQHGHAPESVRTTAKVHLREGDAGPAIQRIDLETEGRVADIDQAHFAEHAEEAKQDCIVSRALAGVEEMNVSARLAG
jgi:osmotically inducible protein OsmC